ncbi:MAG: asparagine--tRNA ligase [Desulfovibrionaceae bacterium]
MDRIEIKTLLESTATQKNVFLAGWIRTLRFSKEITFIELNDGSCLSNIQITIPSHSPLFSACAAYTIGSSLYICGDIIESPGKQQKWEILPNTITLLGTADAATFPLQKKRHSDEFLRTIAHLRPRTNKYGAMLRVRSEAAFAIHSFFKEKGFFYVHTPIITGSDCEGAGEMFSVTTLDPYITPKTKTEEAIKEYYQKDFFSKEASLTVSGQLEAEALMMGLGKVYTFGPTFRAENSNTSRHACEFWMIEPEFAFGDLHDCMNLGESCIHYVVEKMISNSLEDITLFDSFVHKGLLQELNNVLRPFARISYKDAIAILSKERERFEHAISFGTDLQTEHERFLAEEYFTSPVIVYNYPKDIKAFYMKLNDDNETVAAMDILIPRIGELVGGSQREESLSLLENRINSMGMDTKDFLWYLDLRRFGSVPHAGFGLGFERLLMMLTGISNIRDVLPFPRTPGNLEF